MRWPKRKRKGLYMAEEDKTDTTRTSGAEGSRVGKLDPDDPAAGTVDDPSVEDPYAHLRNKEKEQGTAGTTDEEPEEE